MNDPYAFLSNEDDGMTPEEAVELAREARKHGPDHAIGGNPIRPVTDVSKLKAWFAGYNDGEAHGIEALIASVRALPTSPEHDGEHYRAADLEELFARYEGDPE